MEAKKCSEVGKSCWETISAFSNEPSLGGGYLLLGIKSSEESNTNNYEIEGIADTDKIQRDLATQCREVFNITIRPQIETATKDEKIVIVALIPEVQPSEKPVYITKRGLPQGAFTRIASTDQKCTDRDIELFYQERNAQTYDTTIFPDATLDDLDPEAIATYRRERQALNSNASELNFDDQQLLYALNAIARHPTQKGEYCPTIAGLILFGKAIALRRYFPMHRIDYILVEGKEWVSDPDKRYQSLEIREPLLLAIPKLTTLILNDLPKAFNLAENGIHRRETPLIPRKVIREAIVNALMHRNYRERSPVQIIRFSDRLEIRNPGYSLKPTDELDQPGSKTRNEKIAAVLHEVGIAETKGSGGKVMLETMLEANLTLPLFVSNRDRDYFHVTLFTHHLLDTEDIEWLKQFKDYGLSNDEAKALVVLRKAGSINNLIYRDTNDVDTLTASQHLRRLRDAGLLEQQGKGSATCYTLASGLVDNDLSRELTEPEKSNLGSDFLDNGLSRELTKPESSNLGSDSLDNNQHQEHKQLVINLPLEEQEDHSQTDERQNYLVQMPEQLRTKIQKLGRRSNHDQVKTAIIELCSWKSLSSSAIATILDRNQDYLQTQYLTPLLRSEKLKQEKPSNSPQQAYRAT
ncbi:ATP-binding protein [Nostoc sp.]|uniref:ATP-binding protein n=1 Tax=Nostoc sp. TaxID=1180 RepID=UPI002FFB91E1